MVVQFRSATIEFDSTPSEIVQRESKAVVFDGAVSRADAALKSFNVRSDPPQSVEIFQLQISDISIVDNAVEVYVDFQLSAGGALVSCVTDIVVVADTE